MIAVTVAVALIVNKSPNSALTSPLMKTEHLEGSGYLEINAWHMYYSIYNLLTWDVQGKFPMLRNNSQMLRLLPK